MDAAGLDVPRLAARIKGKACTQTINKILRGETRFITPEQAEKIAPPLGIHPCRLLQYAPGGGGGLHTVVIVLEQETPFCRVVNPGPVGVDKVFAALWRIHNPTVGALSGCSLVCTDKEHATVVEQNGVQIPLGNFLTPLRRRVKIPKIPAESTVELRISFNAPFYPGDYVSHWEILTESGEGLKRVEYQIKVVELLENF